MYRIMATTDWEPGPESTGRAGEGGASRDSLTTTKVGETREGQAQEPGFMLKRGLTDLCLLKTEG